MPEILGAADFCVRLQKLDLFALCRVLAWRQRQGGHLPIHSESYRFCLACQVILGFRLRLRVIMSRSRSSTWWGGPSSRSSVPLTTSAAEQTSYTSFDGLVCLTTYPARWRHKGCRSIEDWWRPRHGSFECWLLLASRNPTAILPFVGYHLRSPGANSRLGPLLLVPPAPTGSPAQGRRFPQ